MKVELTQDFGREFLAEPRRVLRIYLTSPEARTVSNGGKLEMEFYMYSGARPALVQVVREPQ